MSLYLNEKKLTFLKEVGFELSYDSEPRPQMGAMLRMQTWKKHYPSDIDELSIFFDSEDGNRCELYRGSGDTPETFSERNLLSELRKRGYGNG